MAGVSVIGPLSRAHYRRNLACFIAVEGMWWAGITFAHGVPFAVIASLGGSWLVELVGYDAVLVGILACLAAAVIVLMGKVDTGSATIGTVRATP